MKLKVDEFISFVIAQIGSYYWYGTFGQTASYKLYDEKKVQYPKYYTASDFSEQIKSPKPCFDCAGLVKSKWVYPKYNASDDLGATGIYNKCEKKGNLDISTLKKGMLVFKGNDKTKTHVGIFIGNGEVVEAKSHAYGVVKTKLSDTSWSYQAEYYNVDYTEEKPDISLKFDSDICKYCKGIDLTVNTKTDPLNFRSSPIISTTNIIGSIPKGAKVRWYGYYVGEFYYVQYNNKYGFASSKYLKI